MKNLSMVLFPFLLLFTISIHANIIHVPLDYPTIQEAINASVNGDTILVAEGIYYENISFNGKAITVASHFLIDKDQAHIDNTIIDGSRAEDTRNASVVRILSGEDSRSTLVGFTITGGTGTYRSNHNVHGGGGIVISFAAAKILNNIIVANFVTHYHPFGGGIVIDTPTDSVIIKNNYIAYNTVTSQGTHSGGGGIFCVWNSDKEIMIVNNIITNNSVINDINNESSGGGGISVFECDPNPIIRNNLIKNNNAKNGAGIYFGGFSGSNNLCLVNNTIINNSARDKGGGIVRSNEGLRNIKSINSIIRDNNAVNDFSQIQGNIEIEYSNVEGGYEGIGNLDLNPLFTDTINYYLSDSSPCIDAGNPDEEHNDFEDPNNLGFALFPAWGSLRNDMGHCGGNPEMLNESPTLYSNWQVYNTLNSDLPEDQIRSLKIDELGNKWIGFQEKGLAKLENDDWTFYNRNNSDFPAFRVSDIAIDVLGNKWFTTFASEGWSTPCFGIVKYDGIVWTTYDTSNSFLPSNTTRCIEIDNSGNKWIGTCTGYESLNRYIGKGLVKFNDLDWTIYNLTNSGLPSNNIYCLAIDELDNIWIGTKESGLVNFDGTNWTIYNRTNSGLVSDNVFCITIDVENNKWIGTSNGLVKFDGTNWTVYNISNSEFQRNSINCITIDKYGIKWIGTYEGLMKFDSVEFEIYKTSNSGLPNNVVYCISIDELNNKWIGTGRGLAVFNEDGIVAVDEKASELNILPNDFVLYQNYPNPFNPTTTIEYSLNEKSYVKFSVYDILGHEISTLVNEKQRAGNYRVIFNVSALSSGVYFYQLRANGIVETKKMIIIK